MIRILDISLGVILLIVLSPVLSLIIAILSVTGEREIFYVQTRIGKFQKNFGIIKFATMLKNSPQMGDRDITIRNDSRVLPIGRILRKTKLNELPQILNIIKGDMSFVGPRPLTIKQFEKYSSSAQVLISSVKPGLTGYGSIIFRDEESLLIDVDDVEKYYTSKIMPKKEQVELAFVNQQSTGKYFFVLLLTAVAVIFPNSTYPALKIGKLTGVYFESKNN
jgi:lipopolysaccharide/colanic/teichoic acid biosynthesis glycosyltransferase